jgi:NADH-quinone oxidoreductase subunit G
MSDNDENTVNIEVDGVPLKARKGQMLMEVTDRADIYVPRFCYHHKLSVAANCRMCLVEVEKAPKPLPACATPVAEGMKVFTRSARAVSAQKATMEFLLINHPLDCPICDQGGECELQDLAMGFGRGISRYTERKRVVKDQDLGPLVSTDMTRCIQCTRCVRFGQEIAGIQELGTVGRGEDMAISTYVEKSVDHELSGNIIDLCPVGALNNKPYRFGARAWEMTAHPLVSPHDCAGSHLYGHVLRGRLRRVVPRDCESINESWISDRDRFSCFGNYAPDRLEKPMVKRDQEWHEVTWTEALSATADALRAAAADEGDALGVLASPTATLEELVLLRRIAGELGTANIDHRLRRTDFRDQAGDPPWPWLGCSIAELERQDAIVVVGSNLRMEVPILAHRLRKAALNGADIGFVDPEDYHYYFRKAAYVDAPLEQFVPSFAAVLVAAAAETGRGLPERCADACAGIEPTEAQAAAAKLLLGKENALVLLGHIAQRHPHFSEIRLIAAELAALTGAKLGYLAEGGNGVGAALAGLLPHRGPGGEAQPEAGLDARGMLASPRRAYVLFGVEPEQDLIEPALAEQALKSADTVICFTPFFSDSLAECADVLLPIATFAETPGTFVNAEGRWQSFAAAAKPVGDARPAWRVLRVLGNELGLAEFDYDSAEDVRAAFVRDIGDVAVDNTYTSAFKPRIEALERELPVLDVPIYSVDALVRRSTPLQLTRLGRGAAADTEPELKSA